MAKQRGPLKIEGTLDEINFIKSIDGYVARMKGGVSASRIKSDPAFALTRQNNVEFTTACKGGKLIRETFATVVKNAADGRMIARLVKEVMKVVKSDTTSARGQRTVNKGNLGFLQGFEFNGNSPLKTTLKAPFMANIDRPSGNMIIHVPAFVPGNLLETPEGSTHFKFVVMGGELDFGNSVYTSDLGITPTLPIDYNPTANIDLNATVPANSTQNLFFLFGVQFFQRVNGLDYAMNNGQFNALQIVAISAS